MNGLDDKPNFAGAGDPLERLIEAFVEQSVPEGPDPAVQKRLLTAMNAVSRCGRVHWSGGSETVLQVCTPPEQEFGACENRLARLVRQSAGPLLGLAAAVAIVAATALVWRAPADNDIARAVPAPSDSVSDSIASGAGSAATDAAEAREFERILNAVDAYINAPRRQRPDRRAFEQMLAAVIRDNPDIARSEAWRRAQQQLAGALETPHVVSMGVGLLGTLSWTHYGRF